MDSSDGCLGMELVPGYGEMAKIVETKAGKRFEMDVFLMYDGMGSIREFRVVYHMRASSRAGEELAVSPFTCLRTCFCSFITPLLRYVVRSDPTILNPIR